MTSRRADVHVLAGPYALNALPARDRARFERHLAGCDECAQEVRGLRETAARLAAAAAVSPPAGLRERVLTAAARTRQLPPVPADSAARWWGARRTTAARRALRAGRRSWVRPLAMAALAAFAAAAVTFGTMTVVTQHRLSQAQASDRMLAAVLTAPDAKLTSAPVTGGGTATIVMSHKMRALAFSSAGLPRLAAGQAYELWLMGPSGNRPAAMLPRPAHAMTSPVIATGLRSGDMVVLTVEPASGAPRPTAAPILRLGL
jgi:anti-sigma-K factor RskA